MRAFVGAIVFCLANVIAGIAEPCSLHPEPPIVIAPSGYAFIGTVTHFGERRQPDVNGQSFGILGLTVTDAVLGTDPGAAVELGVSRLQTDCSTSLMKRVDLEWEFTIGEPVVVITGPNSGYSRESEVSEQQVALFGREIAPFYPLAKQRRHPFDHERNVKLMESLPPSRGVSVHLYGTLEYLRDLTLLNRASDSATRMEILRRVLPWFAHRDYFIRSNVFDHYRALVKLSLPREEEQRVLLNRLPANG